MCTETVHWNGNVAKYLLANVLCGKGKGAILRQSVGWVLISLSYIIEPVGGYTTGSVMHSQCDTRTSYFFNCRAAWYQTVLLGDRGTLYMNALIFITWPELLHGMVKWVLTVVHSSDEPGELSQWLCRNVWLPWPFSPSIRRPVPDVCSADKDKLWRS